MEAGNQVNLNAQCDNINQRVKKMKMMLQLSSVSKKVLMGWDERSLMVVFFTPYSAELL